MAIYLDAEPLYGLAPNSLVLSSLKILARELKIEIAIPEIAVDEACAKQREQIEAKVSGIQREIDKADGFFEPPRFPKPDVESLIAKYRADLVNGMRVIPISGDRAIDSLRREINRRPPARNGVGARDAAIWLSILDDHRAKSEDGYFVSGNTKDFGEPDGSLNPRLRAELELLGSQPFVYVQEISDLFPLLANVGGRPFTVAELESIHELKWMIRGRLNDFEVQREYLNELVLQAFGAPLRWSGVSTNVQNPMLVEILRQRIYQLPNAIEIGVMRTRWVAWVHLQLSGPRDLIEAGFREGQGALTAEVELWARRTSGEPLNVGFSFSGRDKIEVAVDAASLKRPDEP